MYNKRQKHVNRMHQSLGVVRYVETDTNLTYEISLPLEGPINKMRRLVTPPNAAPETQQPIMTQAHQSDAESENQQAGQEQLRAHQGPTTNGLVQHEEGNDCGFYND